MGLWGWLEGAWCTVVPGGSQELQGWGEGGVRSHGLCEPVEEVRGEVVKGEV